MSTEEPLLSAEFRRLYCEPALFSAYSRLHPVSFTRVLPFQHQEEGVDDGNLLYAEGAHLDQPGDDTRVAVVEAYSRCGLLEEEEAAQLRSVVGFFGVDFFDLMGLVYANAGRFRCALRWYRELINHLETQNPNSCSDSESVYAGVGYCLYSLGLFEEAIAWSKTCIGPRAMAEAVSRALIDYEAQSTGGAIRVVERSGPRVKYTVSSFEPAQAVQATPRLKGAIKALAPFQDVYLDWVGHDSPKPDSWPTGYPFGVEFDGGTLVRHKMNLIFATCCLTDELLAKGYQLEAKRLLCEALMIEPAAGIVVERLQLLP